MIFVNWLITRCPMFCIPGDKIKILKTPEEFYERLLNGSRDSKKRITLASLYLGNGQKERKLVELLEISARENESNLSIRILLDGIRCTRKSSECTSILTEAIVNSKNFKVSYFFTPLLKSWHKWLLPGRVKEMIGLQHMKVYIFDNDVLISGANLSHDYFTNRQDRYVVFENCEKIANFYDEIITEVSEMSVELSAKNSNIGFIRENSNFFAQIKTDKYVSDFRARILSIYSKYQKCNNFEMIEKYDTLAFPTLGMPAFNISTECEIVKNILTEAPENTEIDLSTGYFNLSSALRELIIKSKSKFRILLAHPEANGFFNATGVAKYIPDVYSHYAKLFLKRASYFNPAGNINNSRELSSKNNFADSSTKNNYTDSPSENDFADSSFKRITMWEYIRACWTFHAKGVWLNIPNNPYYLSIIGSSNYGNRSETRDLETGVVLITKNADLKQRFADENKRLFDNSVSLTEETFNAKNRKYVFWIPLAAWILKGFF